MTALPNVTATGPTALTLGQLLRERAQARPEATFLVHNGEEISYADFDARVDRVATAWLSLGLQHGDRIAIAGPNSPDWLAAYMASARIGTVLVTLNLAYRESEFRYMLGQSRARVVVCEAEAEGFDFVALLDQLQGELPDLEHIVVTGATGSGHRRWDDLANAEPDVEAVAAAGERVTPQDPAVILYTSGTTGKPKGATLTHRSLIASAAAQADRFEQTPSDVFLCPLPFNHVGGLTVAFGSALVSGGAVHVLPRFRPDLVFASLASVRPTILLGVPTMYAMMLGAEGHDDLDTASVRLCIVGGSNLEPALADRITDMFAGTRLANLYGLSESSGACVISPTEDDLAAVSRSIGTIIGDFEARAVDAHGGEVASGETGELQVRGACVAAGYWEMPEASAQTFLDSGWLATGDMVAMEADGHIRVLGRQKEMYVRGGLNVYPAQTENLLSKHPWVAMCAVIGMPEPTFGETGCAFIVPVPGTTIDPEELRQWCQASLAAYKVPDRFVIVDSLPLTPAGKIRKVALAPPTD